MPHLRYAQHTWPELAELAARVDVNVEHPAATSRRAGSRWLARAQEEIAGFIREVRDRPHPQPVDHH